MRERGLLVMDQESSGRFDGIDGRLTRVDGRLDGIDARFERLEGFIEAEGAKTRRHFEIVAEGLRTDIKVLADGHDALSRDLAELKAGQVRLETGHERLEVRLLALEHRRGRTEEA